MLSISSLGEVKCEPAAGPCQKTGPGLPGMRTLAATGPSKETYPEPRWDIIE